MNRLKTYQYNVIKWPHLPRPRVLTPDPEVRSFSILVMDFMYIISTHLGFSQLNFEP